MKMRLLRTIIVALEKKITCMQRMKYIKYQIKR